MTQSRRRWIAAPLLFLLPLALLYAPGLPHGKYELVVDMQAGDKPATATGALEVWINSTFGESFRQDTVAGLRRAYRFSLEKHKTIDYLRIDPTDVPGVPVHLFGVRIEKQGQIIHQFTAQDLAAWHTNAEHSTLERDAVLLRAEHRDPQLDARFSSIALPGTHRSLLGRLVPRLLSTDHSRATILALLSVSTLLVVLLGVRRGGGMTALVLALALPATCVLLALVGRLDGRPPDGGSALGYALYAGYPKSVEILLGPVLIGVPVLIALAAVYLRRRLTTAPLTDARDPSPPERARGRSHVIVLTLLVAVLACYFCPDLAAARPSNAAPIALQWDGNNALTWRYLIQSDAQLYKDFWYPYSGQMLFELAYPYGDLFLALHRFVLFTVLLLAIYLSTGRALAATLAIFGSLFALYIGGVFEWPERYGLVVNVLLAYQGIDRSVPRLRPGHVLFWLALVHVAIIEPTSALYVGVPIFLSLALDLFRSPAEFRAALLGRLSREFAAPAAILAGVAIYLGARGELEGFVAFMASLGTQAAYGAHPLDILAWLTLDLPSEAFLLASIVVLVGIGVVREFAGARRQGNDGRVLLLLGVAAAMLMLKQFMRPHIANQLLIVNVAGMLFYLFAGQKANGWQWGGAVVSAGFLFAHLAVSSIPFQVVNQVRNSVARAKASVPCLALHAEERQALTALQFAPQHFQLSGAHMQVMQELLDLAGSEATKPLFVLSDDPIFYVLTGTRPYFHTNGYNAAPILEQKHMLQLFQAAPPRVIIWRSNDGGVDGVPPVLRDPLLYEYVILHYVPLSAASPNPFALLRRREPEEPLALDFWRQRLGNVLHLGHIPRFSSMAKFPKATSGAAEKAAEFLTIEITDLAALNSQPPPAILELPRTGGYRPTGRSLVIPIECAGRCFSLALSIVPGQTEYHVLLNRIWFWGALKKAGLTPTLGNAGCGVEVHIERRAMNDALLY
jgi:hypothetical protein